MQKYLIATESQNSSMPTNVFKRENFSICLDNDKIPYLKNIPYKIIKQEKKQSIIEITVDSFALMEFMYAGVRYGMDIISQKNRVA